MKFAFVVIVVDVEGEDVLEDVGEGEEDVFRAGEVTGVDGDADGAKGRIVSSNGGNVRKLS